MGKTTITLVTSLEGVQIDIVGVQMPARGPSHSFPQLPES